MFWRFGAYANISTIDTILEKPDFTLEELLDEADLIQELKQHNAKLVEYLREPIILEKLLEYVVVPRLEPIAIPDDEAKNKDSSLSPSRPRASSRATDSGKDEDAEKTRNKYAFVAAEVLSSDNWSIYEALMESRHLLQNFWQFLKMPTPLDPLQASYFTKVNEALFDKKTEEMIDLLKSLNNAVPDMLKHVDCPMIMDLLLKIISLERTDSGQGIVEWLYTQDAIPTLLSFLGPEHNWATQTSAGDFIKAIITVSANASQNEQTCIGPNELTRQLVSQTCVEQLIQYMLAGGNPLTVGVGIVIEVIRKNNSDYDPDVGTEPDSIPSSRDPIYLGTLLRLFAQHVPDFMNLIMNAPAQRRRLESTFGGQIEPLGFDRFKTCELMAELLHCSNMALLNEAGSEEVIASRDAHRQRLRKEGRLLVFPSDEVPSSVDGLAMRMSHSSIPDEARRLGVTNISIDEDGFEEVTHGGDDDTSHEFVRAEEDMPDLPEAPSHIRSSSFLDRDDDDFVDEPLSSPRLNVREVDDTGVEGPGFEDPALMVAPLSPKKQQPAGAEKASAAESSTEAGEAAEESLSPADLRQASATPGSDPLGLGKTLPATSSAQPPSLEAPAPVSSPPKTAAATEGGEPAQSGEVAEEHEAKEDEMDISQAGPAEASVVSGPTAASEMPHQETQPGPVVGDYLKMQFVEHGVVPAILSFFFEYPWNNFLHNVVYDVVQQVFNGPMDRGCNSTLAIALFEAADITSQIIKGQKASELSQARTKTRMGYMGHLTLIAEEVVKFTERHPPGLLSETVLERVMSQDWISYVEGALAETRERDNAILGGVRPEVAMSNRAGAAGLGGMGLSGMGFSMGGANSQGASNVLANVGLNGSIGMDDNGSNSVGPFSISSGTLMSGFGSSSDDEDDEEQESEEDVNNEFRAYTDHLNPKQSSLDPPSIPPPPPPPPPLNIPPSRARLQLAARLAMHKRNSMSGEESEGEKEASPADRRASEDMPESQDDMDLTSGFAVLQEAPQLTSDYRPWEIKDPFADDDDDYHDDGDVDGVGGGNGSDEGMGDDGDSGGWNRGSWWRDVVRRTKKGGADSKGKASDESDGSEGVAESDDEEFGDFAMPSAPSAPPAPSRPEGASTEAGAEPAGGGVLLKPLPVHPTVSKPGTSAFGSLWPFSTGNGKGKGEEGKVTATAAAPAADEGGSGKTPDTRGSAEPEGPEPVLGEDGQRIDRAVEATRRTSIEDPDEE